MSTEKATVEITAPGVFKYDAHGVRAVDADGNREFHKVGADVSLPGHEARALVDSGVAVFKNKTEAKTAGAPDAPTTAK